MSPSTRQRLAAAESHALTCTGPAYHAAQTEVFRLWAEVKAEQRQLRLAGLPDPKDLKAVAAYYTAMSAEASRLFMIGTVSTAVLARFAAMADAIPQSAWLAANMAARGFGA